MMTPRSSQFARLSDDELACLYRALCTYLGDRESESWFHRAAKGDPSFRRVAEGRTDPRTTADSPSMNTLFAIGHEVHRELARRDPARMAQLLEGQSLVFESWKAFCRGASEAAETEAKAHPTDASLPIHDPPPSTE